MALHLCMDGASNLALMQNEHLSGFFFGKVTAQVCDYLSRQIIKQVSMFIIGRGMMRSYSGTG